MQMLKIEDLANWFWVLHEKPGSGFINSSRHNSRSKVPKFNSTTKRRMSAELGEDKRQSQLASLLIIKRHWSMEYSGAIMAVICPQLDKFSSFSFVFAKNLV